MFEGSVREIVTISGDCRCPFFEKKNVFEICMIEVDDFSRFFRNQRFRHNRVFFVFCTITT